MYLPELPWSVPVHVTFQNGTYRIFSSVMDALDFLENEWPRRTGTRYQLAVQTCQRALRQATPKGVAREAFISACLEAGLPATSAPSAFINAVREVEHRSIA